MPQRIHLETGWLGSLDLDDWNRKPLKEKQKQKHKVEEKKLDPETQLIEHGLKRAQM